MTVSKTTSGIKVGVTVTYQESHSRPDSGVYVFSYHIHIENRNPYPVQLLRRKWVITNGYGEIEVVEGDGVVGRQPILYSGEEYEYSSGAAIESQIGVMHGIYYFENKSTRDVFEVKIPEFKLETTEILN